MVISADILIDKFQFSIYILTFLRLFGIVMLSLLITQRREK
jgi:hypothetical protein